MGAVTCRRCHELLPEDAAYCPRCGAQVPDGPGSFVLQAASDDTSEALFTKPTPQKTLSSGALVVGLAALLIAVIVTIVANGTGSDVVAAPTPTPVPSPIGGDDTAPSAGGPDSEAIEYSARPIPVEPARDGDTGDDATAGPDLTGAELDDLVRVEAGSGADDYVAAFLSLARTYDLDGTVVFTTAAAVTRLDLGTGAVTQIPLDGRDYQLGARSGIVASDPGRTIVAHRWDEPSVRIEVAAGYKDFLGSPWVDPNGWELVSYSASGGKYVMAPWDRVSPDSPNVPVAEQPDPNFFGPVKLRSPRPHRWTWDDGELPLPWDEVLASNNDGSFLVRDCDGPGRCGYLVVDDEDNLVVSVAESMAQTDLDGGQLVLSGQGAALWSSATGAAAGEAFDPGEIIDLETGAKTPVPPVDRYAAAIDGFWLDDELLVLVLGIEPTTYVVLDREGAPVAEFAWPAAASTGPALSYFAPQGRR